MPPDVSGRRESTKQRPQTHFCVSSSHQFMCIQSTAEISNNLIIDQISKFHQDFRLFWGVISDGVPSFQLVGHLVVADDEYHQMGDWEKLSN